MEDTTTLVKCAKRQMRRGCPFCRYRGWWYHDESGLANDVKVCEAHDSNNWVMCDESGTPHTCNGVVITPSMTVEVPDEEGDESPKPAPAPRPASNGGLAGNDAAQEALAALAKALTPKAEVDAAAVRAIVNEELAAKGMLPLRVEYARPDGSYKELDGMVHAKLPEVLSFIKAGIRFKRPSHVWMHGPGGSGKSSIAPQVAKVLDVPFYPISIGPGTTQSNLMGYMLADGYQSTAWVNAIIGGGLVLLDEADTAHPSIVTVLNAALANKYVGLPDGRTVEVHDNFYVIAAGNTTGNGADRVYRGRNGLDKAFLDRFSLINVGYDHALEEAACRAFPLDGYKVAKVLKYVRDIRDNVLKHEMPELVGMRASIEACMLLADGVKWPTVIETRIRHGMSDQDWSKVTTGVDKPVI